MARRVVLFDLGVLIQPSLQQILDSCEREWGLPSRFLRDSLFAGGSQSPFGRAARGEITLSQLVSELDGRCRRRADSLGIAIPEGFSAARPFRELQERGQINGAVMGAAEILRDNGFVTAVLTNSWLDDGPGRSCRAELLRRLRSRLRPFLESCRIGAAKPEPGAFRRALSEVGARPQEVILVSGQPEELPGARALGMAAAAAAPDAEAALRELQELTGVQLLGRAEPPLPPPCAPDEAALGNVEIRPGVRLHFAELGQGPALCLCHGFPESWRAWRYQIPALAGAGFRVLALQMKGYGESQAPPDIAEYSQERICEDFVTFLDKLGLSQVVLVGHDWGGAMAWNVALFYPERVRAVAVLNTPYRPAQPGIDVLARLESHPAFDYQLYFQQPGVAEAELEQNIERTLKVLIRAWEPQDRLPVGLDMRRVRERGGLLVGMPADPPCSRLLPPAELEFYTRQFQKSGFRGPLNWYRNLRENWEWALRARERKISLPALLVTAGRDPVLHPDLSKGMEAWIPRLRREHIQDCGHWTQLERPAEVNRILLDWLRSLPPEPPPNSGNSGNSKL